MKIANISPFISWTGLEGDISETVVPNAEHRELLSLHNGLVAFWGGLRIFGLNGGSVQELQRWNAKSSWRFTYKELVKDYLVFFAEDAFGNQFCYKDSGTDIYSFLAETGQIRLFAPSLEMWVSRISEDPAGALKLPLLQEWQSEGGNLLKGTEHLCPTYPFITQAETVDVHTLYKIEGIEDMRYKGNFAYQIKDVPDGSKIQIKVTE